MATRKWAIGVVAWCAFPATPPAAAPLFEAPFYSFPTGHLPSVLVVDDLDNDGIPDLIVNQAAASAVAVLRGRGDGTFEPPRDLPVGAPAALLAVVDADGDGNLDVIVGRDEIAVLPGDGMGGFKALRTSAGTSYARSMTLADWN